MRRSAALLAHRPVRLAELNVPSGYVHVLRARLVPYLEKLPHVAEIDRDGRLGVLNDAAKDRGLRSQTAGSSTRFPWTVRR